MGKIKSFTVKIEPEIVSQTYPELTEAQVAAVMEELIQYETDIFDFIFEKIEAIVEDTTDGDDEEDDEEDDDDDDDDFEDDNDEPWMDDEDDEDDDDL